MKKFIRVTENYTAKRDVIIFIDHIIGISRFNDGSLISTGGFFPMVSESLEEIINLIRNAES